LSNVQLQELYGTQTVRIVLQVLGSSVLHSGYHFLSGNDIRDQAWGTCGPREHFIWPASGFSLPKLEYTPHQNEAP